MNNKKEIAAYVRNNVEDYELRLQLALKVIGCDRCGLKQAAPMLYNEIVDTVCEWCSNNDVSEDSLGNWDDFLEGDNGIIWEE